MPTFLEQHADKVVGALSCFDRVLLRGYLPLESGWTMAEFLRAKGVDRLKLKPFLLEQAERLKEHSFKLAKEAGRPCQYLPGHARKEDLAREIAKKDSILKLRLTKAEARGDRVVDGPGSQAVQGEAEDRPSRAKAV